jgi:hypothetical protein
LLVLAARISYTDDGAGRSPEDRWQSSQSLGGGLFSQQELIPAAAGLKVNACS